MSGHALASTVAGRGPRLVLLHGFTQTSRCWGPFGDALSRHHEVVSVDAPGHGDSGDVAVDMVGAARLLGDAGGRAIYAGYSMGGRIALRLALDRPELVRALILVGASPGIKDPLERAARRAEDEARAVRLVDIGVAAFVDEWLRAPLFATLPAERAYRAERCTNTAGGLAASLRLVGTGAQEPLWDRLGCLAVPVLLLAGANDAKFAALATRMAGAIGERATVALVADAGHSAHLEAPEATTAIVRTWLARLALA